MLVICPKCFTQYVISDEIKVPEGQKFHCCACGNYFSLKSERQTGFYGDDAALEEEEIPTVSAVMSEANGNNGEIITANEMNASSSESEEKIEEKNESSGSDEKTQDSVLQSNQDVEKTEVEKTEPTFSDIDSIALLANETPQASDRLDTLPEAFKPVETKKKKTSFISALFWLCVAGGICYGALYLLEQYPLLEKTEDFIASKLDKNYVPKEKTPAVPAKNNGAVQKNAPQSVQPSADVSKNESAAHSPLPPMKSEKPSVDVEEAKTPAATTPVPTESETTVKSATDSVPQIAMNQQTAQAPKPTQLLAQQAKEEQAVARMNKTTVDDSQPQQSQAEQPQAQAQAQPQAEQPQAQAQAQPQAEQPQAQAQAQPQAKQAQPQAQTQEQVQGQQPTPSSVEKVSSDEAQKAAKLLDEQLEQGVAVESLENEVAALATEHRLSQSVTNEPFAPSVNDSSENMAQAPQAQEPQAQVPQAQVPTQVSQAQEAQAQEPQAQVPTQVSQAQEPQAQVPTQEPQAQAPQAQEPQVQAPQAQVPQAQTSSESVPLFTVDEPMQAKQINVSEANRILKIQDIAYEISQNEAGVMRLMIKGVVANTELTKVVIPQLKAIVYDQNDNPIARKRIILSQPEIDGNSVQAFFSSVVPAPEQVSHVEVVFDE